MKTTVLKSMPYAQAKVLFTSDLTVLVSYTTAVAAITTDGWLTVFGLYSMTTRRHIGAFMREYCNSNYQFAKWLYENGYTYNLNTGEVRLVGEGGVLYE